MKLGDKTNGVWAGELVIECEFICDLEDGKMLFYDNNNKCFRLVFYQHQSNDDFILNGWKCANTISELLNLNNK